MLNINILIDLYKWVIDPLNNNSENVNAWIIVLEFIKENEIIKNENGI